jgi:hypothetical protein
MKTSTSEKRISGLRRWGASVLGVAGALLLGAGGCNEAGQGDRCNPLRSSNECGSGLVCAGNPIGQSTMYPIAFCPENYCCPVDSAGNVDFANASSPFCQPGCNGGAAALCAAGGGEADAAACEVATCLADASDPSSCVSESDGGDDSTESEGGDDSAVPSEASTSDATASDATLASDATSAEASTSEAGPVEAATEAAAPSEAGSVADSASSD